jgi:hypothetical protein
MPHGFQTGPVYWHTRQAIISRGAGRLAGRPMLRNLSERCMKTPAILIGFELPRNVRIAH